MKRLPEILARPLRDVVYEHLKEAILLGRLLPGERLLEVELAEQMGVSRTPVREAMRRLDREGLVALRPFRGAEVVRVPRERAEQLFQVRDALESLAARLAASRTGPADLLLLRSIVEQAQVAAQNGDYPGVNALNRRFHAEMARLSGNAPLATLLEQIQDHINLLRVTALSRPGRPEEAICEHVGIVEALAAGDGPRAEMLVREHIQRGRQAALAQMEASKEGRHVHRSPEV
ncbi:MAG: GntR family transcriptional regulator [Bacillota bacterium]|nr:GntR family transcriptional regulator [Bacillota bacterium]